MCCAACVATNAASTFLRRNAEIDRFLWHVREQFDAQLTALSNLCEPSSSAAAHAVDCDAVLAPLKAAGDLPTQ